MPPPVKLTAKRNMRALVAKKKGRSGMRSAPVCMRKKRSANTAHPAAKPSQIISMSPDALLKSA